MRTVRDRSTIILSSHKISAGSSPRFALTASFTHRLGSRRALRSPRVATLLAGRCASVSPLHGFVTKRAGVNHGPVRGIYKETTAAGPFVCTVASHRKHKQQAYDRMMTRFRRWRTSRTTAPMCWPRPTRGPDRDWLQPLARAASTAGAAKGKAIFVTE